jgi:galactosylceramidase
VNNVGDGYGCAPKAYYLRLAAEGAYALVAINGKAGEVELGDKEHQAMLLAAGQSGERGEKQIFGGALKDFDAGKWHNVKLRFSGDKITGFVDGVQVLAATSDLYAHGMAGLVTGDTEARNTACFDNVLVNAVGAAVPAPTVFAGNQKPIYRASR